MGSNPLVSLYLKPAGRVGRQVYFINTTLVLILTFLTYFMSQMLFDVQVQADLSESPFWAFIGVRVVPIIILAVLYVCQIALTIGWVVITAKRMQDIGL